MNSQSWAEYEAYKDDQRQFATEVIAILKPLGYDISHTRVSNIYVVPSGTPEADCIKLADILNQAGVRASFRWTMSEIEIRLHSRVAAGTAKQHIYRDEFDLAT